MTPLDTEMAWGTCPECGHNDKADRVTVQMALPVVLDFLSLTSVAGLLSDDAAMGLAIEDVLEASLRKINEGLNK